MRVLFIGGNGNISWHCVQKLLELGYDVWILNRAITRNTRRMVQKEVTQIICDIRDVNSIKEKLSGLFFDCVCDFICKSAVEAEERIAIFSKITVQYIYISSDVVYKRITSNLPYRETSELWDINEVSGYTAGKLGAEIVYKKAFDEKRFPVTIIRPSMTYDTLLHTPVGLNDFSQAQKVLEGRPIFILGDGITLVTPMHSKDFASAFAYIIGNYRCIGEIYNITGDVLMTWNECMEDFLEALSCKENGCFHIPLKDVDVLNIFKDKMLVKIQMNHQFFDNSKIKKLLPEWECKILYKDGIKNTVQWLMEKKERIRINEIFSQQLDLLYKKYVD